MGNLSIIQENLFGIITYLYWMYLIVLDFILMINLIILKMIIKFCLL